MFADDATLHLPNRNVHNIETHLNSDLREIENWCLQNQMIHEHRQIKMHAYVYTTKKIKI